MKRRDFLRTAGGAAGAATAATAAASSAAAEGGVSAVQDGNTTQPGGNQTDGGGNQTDAGGNQTDGGGNQTDGGGLPGAGQTQTIAVGPNGDNVFDPDSVEILPGTQVVFEWESDTHNIVPDGQPGDANWSGITDIHNTGFTYSHTFTVEGTYDYYCEPHRSQGMTGSITVTTDAGGGGGGGGYEPPDPSHMGIPVQKHFVGALAFMGIFVTLVFTFYLLKYGESAHTAAPGKED